MALKQKIQDDLKIALKNKDQARLSILRMLCSEIHNAEIEKRKDATDEEALAVLAGAAKKHEDSITQFKTGGRDDLVQKEQTELDIIRSYLPAQLTEPEIKALIAEAVAETQAEGPVDFGKVMKKLMPKTKGRANGQVVSALVKEQIK